MAGMGRVARYYLRWLGMFLAAIAAIFAADVALCLVLGSDWFGGIYLSMANFLFLLMFGIATMQWMNFAALLLGCGVTRKALTGGWLLAYGAGAVLTAALGEGLGQIAAALVPRELVSLSAALADMPWWLTLELALFCGALMSDFAVLAARGGWAVAGGVLLMMLAMFLLMGLPALCALLGAAEQALLAAGLLALTAAGLVPVVRRLRRLEL